MFKKNIDIYDYFKFFLRNILTAGYTLHIKESLNDEQIEKLGSKIKIIRLMFAYGLFIEQMNEGKIPKLVSNEKFIDIFASCLVLAANEINLNDNELNVLLENIGNYFQKLDEYLREKNDELDNSNIRKYSNKIGCFLTEELTYELKIKPEIETIQKEEYEIYYKKYSSLLAMIKEQQHVLNELMISFLKKFKILVI